MCGMNVTLISALSLFRADCHSYVSGGSDTDRYVSDGCDTDLCYVLDRSDTDPCFLYYRLTVTTICQMDLTLISALSLFEADCHSYVSDGSDTDLLFLYFRLTVTAR